MKLLLTLLLLAGTVAQADCMDDCGATGTVDEICKSRCASPSSDNRPDAMREAERQMLKRRKQGTTDWPCVNRCTAAGSDYLFCKKHCTN